MRLRLADPTRCWIMERARTARAVLAAMTALALGALGCGGGLSVTKLSSIQGRPNNLAVFIAVEPGKKK
jgi:hypothetical protein